jgi:hypothetical protein
MAPCPSFTVDIGANLLSLIGSLIALLTTAIASYHVGSRRNGGAKPS